MRQATIIRTTVELRAFGLATQQFHEHEKRWPTNLTELQANKSGLVYFSGSLKDSWNRPYIFNPPTDNSPGKIDTYGADGNPNGDKSDGDATFQFSAQPQ